MNRNNGKGPRPELKLNPNPSQPRRGSPSVAMNSPTRSSTSSSSRSSSPPSSCVSSDTEQGRHGRSPEEATSMVLVGCPQCLMYVMLSEDDPKCPKCKTTVLLDFNDPNKGSK